MHFSCNLLYFHLQIKVTPPVFVKNTFKNLLQVCQKHPEQQERATWLEKQHSMLICTGNKWRYLTWKIGFIVLKENNVLFLQISVHYKSKVLEYAHFINNLIRCKRNRTEKQKLKNNVTFIEHRTFSGIKKLLFLLLFLQISCSNGRTSCKWKSMQIIY